MVEEERKSLVEWKCHSCANYSSEVMTSEMARKAQMEMKMRPICENCGDRMWWSSIRGGIDPSALFNCQECGYLTSEKPGRKTFREPFDDKKMCFMCKFWYEKTLPEIAMNPRTLRTPEGRHYSIGYEDAPPYSSMRGFGGRLHYIRFHDGRVVKSTNLWTQGQIPPRFRERLPVNGEFFLPKKGEEVNAQTLPRGSESKE